ncbi:MAG: hypothetical protein HQM11_19810 [SAR324 cluster bacterium]|nr:hypothetical protein [SAR324 cluster bacterium]
MNSVVETTTVNTWSQLIQVFIKSSDYHEHRILGLAVFALFFLMGMLLWG